MTSVPGLALGTLDIGGTHVTAALADITPAATELPVAPAPASIGVAATAANASPELGMVAVRPESVQRHPLRSDGPADEILAALTAAGRMLDLPATAWLGIALPGPFDIVRGIGRYRAVGKFDALNGVDVRTPLAQGLGLSPDRLVFVPDAQAFLRGEWVAGAAAGHDRAAGITLGTGVGSAWLADGDLVADGELVPPQGLAHLLEYEGKPLEDTMSRRAILKAYAGGDGIDVQEVFERARSGEDRAKDVIDTALTALGRALGPWLDGFGATVLVVGGAMSGSWDLVEPPLRAGLVEVAPTLDDRLMLSVAEQPELSFLIGAAWQCARTAAAV